MTADRLDQLERDMQYIKDRLVQICEIEGDTAYAESYVLVALLNRDGVSTRMINGRYIDQLERRDGVWKIALRRSTVDVLISGDAAILQSPLFKQQGYVKGTQDGRDLCYQRPLTWMRPRQMDGDRAESQTL